MRLKKYNKNNKPKVRTTGKSLKNCERCGNVRGHISKYNLNLCRRCFRQIATKIGFTKFS